jgi:hypothetical protein
VQQAVQYLHSRECCCHSFIGILGGVPGGYDCNGCRIHRENEILADDETSDCVHHDTLVRAYPDAIHCVSGTPWIVDGVHQRSWSVSSYYRLSASAEESSNIVKMNVCFVLGKSRSGLPLHLATTCQSFVHVPHVDIDLWDASKETPHHHLPAHMEKPRSTYLIDREACLSIVLHHYTTWAKYPERIYHDHKYQVERPTCKSIRDHTMPQNRTYKEVNDSDSKSIEYESSILGFDELIDY